MREESGFRAGGARPFRLRLLAEAFANFVQNGGGRVSGNDRDGDDTTASGFHFFAANDLIAGPVAAFGENVGKESGDEILGSQVVKDDHSIDGFEGGENFRTFTLRNHRTARAFQLAHAAVAVEANDERITEFASELKTANVARMEQVEATVGEDDAAAVAFLAAKPQNHFLECEDRRSQRVSMQERTSDSRLEKLVYHAQERRRLQARIAR